MVGCSTLNGEEDVMPRTKTAPENETKRQRFVRLANDRVPKALKRIQLIGNLSSKVQYEYTQKDVDRIVKSLRDAVEELEYRMGGEGGNGETAWNIENGDDEEED
jgi:hypothetical protein